MKPTSRTGNRSRRMTANKTPIGLKFEYIIQGLKISPAAKRMYISGMFIVPGSLKESHETSVEKTTNNKLITSSLGEFSIISLRAPALSKDPGIVRHHPFLRVFQSHGKYT